MTPLFLSARRVSSSSSGLSSTRRMTLSLIAPRTSSRMSSSPFGRVSENPPGAPVYPVGDIGVAVVHALVDFVGCIASVYEGRQPEHKAGGDNQDQPDTERDDG